MANDLIFAWLSRQLDWSKTVPRTITFKGTAYDCSFWGQYAAMIQALMAEIQRLGFAIGPSGGITDPDPQPSVADDGMTYKCVLYAENKEYPIDDCDGDIFASFAYCCKLVERLGGNNGN